MRRDSIGQRCQRRLNSKIGGKNRGQTPHFVAKFVSVPRFFFRIFTLLPRLRQKALLRLKKAGFHRQKKFRPTALLLASFA